jgi:hypothetical protein
MSDINPEIADSLRDYLAGRGSRRAEAVDRALATLRPFERRLVREAAVMGYVRGAMRGRARATMGLPSDGDIGQDAATLFEVIDGCIGMSDLYPYLAAASEGRRRRVTRMWPGEQR